MATKAPSAASCSSGQGELVQRGQRVTVEHPDLADPPTEAGLQHDDPHHVLHAQVLRQVLHHRPRHIQRVLQEQPEIADRAHLEGEAQTVVFPAPFPDQLPVHVVEVEEPLQFRTGRLLHEPPVRCSLLISQKFHRHAGSHLPDSSSDLSPSLCSTDNLCARHQDHSLALVAVPLFPEAGVLLV